MNWYRIKTVLIFLFLAINIFLAALLGIEGLSKTRAAKEKVAAAAAALEKNGIEVLCEVPHETPRLGTLTLENPKAEPQKFAEQILGGKATRLGDTWRRDGKAVTLLDKGFVYESGEKSVAPEKKTVQQMRTVLESMGFSMTYAEGYPGDTAVTFVQLIDGVQLFECVLSVHPAADGTVARAEGAWAAVVESAGEKLPVKSAADALLSFLREGHAGSTITEITCGYAVLLSEEGYRTADAVPVWRVETADGNLYYYDARQ